MIYDSDRVPVSKHSYQCASSQKLGCLGFCNWHSVEAAYAVSIVASVREWSFWTRLNLSSLHSFLGCRRGLLAVYVDAWERVSLHFW